MITLFNIISNYDELTKAKTIIGKMLDTSDISCLCGERLYSSDLAFYQYPNSNEYWLYAHCTNCEYDLNYQKIYRRFMSLKGEDKRFKQ